MDERLKALLFPRSLCLGCDEPREIDAGAPYQWDGSKLKTGYMLGKVFSIIYIVVVALYILFIIFAIIVGLSS